VSEVTEGDVSYACMRAFVDQLAHHGVRLACIAPGSRSAPLVIALARHGGIDVRVHLDERAAAFYALGRAKATGEPAIVACTSGTAAANFLPAVVEASQGCVPLIVLTADRPPELRGTGANQTIVQPDLYGVYPRWAVDAPVPAVSEGAARAWRELAARAFTAAAGWPAGPVHVNLPFREPLVPTGAAPDLGSDAAMSVELPRVPDPDPSDVAWLADEVARTERGVVIATTLPHAAPSVSALARAAGYPFFAEPMSGLRTPGGALAAGQAVLSAAQLGQPDLVVQFGPPPLSRASQALIAAARTFVVAEPHGRPADAWGTAARRR